MKFSGVYRISAAVTEVALANPAENCKRMLSAYESACAAGAALLAFPELALTGATCGDLFFQEVLIRQSEAALLRLAAATAGKSTVMVVGVPMRSGHHLYNCAAVLADGKIAGFTVKSLASAESGRYFQSWNSPEAGVLELNGAEIPAGNTLLYKCDGFSFAVEFGDDLFSPLPPSAPAVLNGAQAVVCLGAVPFTMQASSRLHQAVVQRSASLCSACLFVNAGRGESTSSCAFSGGIITAENGELRYASTPFTALPESASLDFVPRWLMQLRRRNPAFSAAAANGTLPLITLPTAPEAGEDAELNVTGTPFIPEDEEERSMLCGSIIDTQAEALMQRVKCSGAQRLVIGVSGGLDSTMALLACARCCQLMEKDASFMLAVTMPGLGTGKRTKSNAKKLASYLGAEVREISIRHAVMRHFDDIRHDPEKTDVVYENAQARERTQILMDLANQENGIVIGTGDLSEIALGWCTFNGDHMSMYSVNGTIPKSLMRAVVEEVASQSSGKMSRCLRDIIDTPVSPELLPDAQHTEKIIGDYTLHDFFLYYFVKYSETPENLRILAKKLFAGIYSSQEIEKTLGLFLRRFMTQQFKRNSMPEGPDTGEISLSPRGGWQMPADADITLWR